MWIGEMQPAQGFGHAARSKSLCVGPFAGVLTQLPEAKHDVSRSDRTDTCKPCDQCGRPDQNAARRDVGLLFHLLFDVAENGNGLLRNVCCVAANYMIWKV
jgi:hypothetical protein